MSREHKAARSPEGGCRRKKTQGSELDMKWPPDVRLRNPLVPEAVPGKIRRSPQAKTAFLVSVVLGCWALGFAHPVDFGHSGMSV